MTDELTPHSYLYRFADPVSGASVWRCQSGEWNGQRPQGFVAMYTGDQVEAALATHAAQIEALTAELNALREALEPFARIADMEHRAGPADSVMVNVARCRDARAALGEPTDGR